MELARLYKAWWRTVQRRYYEAALANLQRVNPCHEDIPWLVHKLNQLEK